MTFGGAFVPTFSGVFDRGGAPAAIPWWDPGGTFTAVAAYQAKGAASLAASYTNLVTPGTYDAAPGVAPTWAAGTGWTFDGSTQFLRSSVRFTQSWTAVYRFSNVTNNGSFGSSGAGKLFLLAPRRGGGITVRYGYGTTITDIAPGMSSGVLALAGGNRYRDGIADGVFSAETFTATIDCGIGCAISSFNLAFAFSNGNIEAVAIYSTTLSATQVATLTTQMNAL